MVQISKNKLALFILCFSILALGSVLVLANPSVNWINMTSPANNTWDNDGVTTFRYEVAGNETGNNSNGYTCTLYWNVTGTLEATSNVQSGVNNISLGSKGNFTETGIADQNLVWVVGCRSAGNSTYVFPLNTTGGFRTTENVSNSNVSFLRFDSTNPSISINSPKEASWNTNGTAIQFNITVTETLGADACVLETNLNESLASNTTGSPSGWFNFSAETVKYTTGSSVIFQFGYNKTAGSTAVKWLDSNTGGYLWNVFCNDSAGNTARAFTTNGTFFIDSVLPGKVNITSPVNGTMSTDLTPTFMWNISRDLNFSRYAVIVDNDSDFQSPLVYTNITVNSTNHTIISSGILSKDTNYFVRIISYDMVNNSVNSSLVAHRYDTDGICGTLIADTWNICAIINSDGINATTLCDQTSCTFVSQYVHNSSHDFLTYTSGASTNGNMYFASGSTGTNNASTVAFIYVSNTNKTWENRTWGISQNNMHFNLTNISSGWNIVPMLNQTFSLYNLGIIDRSVNGNITVPTNNNGTISKFMSHYIEENTTNKYHPHVINKGFNNNTVIEYGEAIWIHLNKSISTFAWRSNGEI